MLQEYIDQFYVEHYEEFGDDVNKAIALQNIPTSRNWLYKGKVGYVVDSAGYIHYFLIIENMPKDIKDSIKYGIGTKTYADYANCKDVWGITEDLKVYYCSEGYNSIDGVTLGDLSQENGNDLVFTAGSPFAQLITNSNDGSVTKADIRGTQRLTIDSSVEIDNLNDLYNFTNLDSLTLKNITLSNLDGVEYLARLQKVYIDNCTIGNYSRLSDVSNQIVGLYILRTTNEEVNKLCDSTIGIGGKDFPNLIDFAICGDNHYSYGGNRDTATMNFVETAVLSTFSDVSYLSNLSKKTKEAIVNLFLNNNNISVADNLYEFVNVQLLRIECNNLTSLSGLYNISEGKGMTNVKYLHVNNNKLGLLEEETLNEEVDSLSILSIKSVDDVTGETIYEKRFNNLGFLVLFTNRIIHLNYLKCYTNLSYLYLSGNSNLNLDNGVQSIMGLLENGTTYYTCDSYVKDYINANSKKIPSISLSGKTMKSSSFATFMEGRGNYLRKLDLTNFVLIDDDENVINNQTTIKYNDVINDALDDLTNLFSLIVMGDSLLTSIDCVENMTSLCEIDLRGTSVADLEPLSNISSLYDHVSHVFLDYSNIVVANEADANGYAEITPVEILFNNTYSVSSPTGLNRAYLSYADNPGVSLHSRDLVSQLSKSTNIVNFKSGYYNFGKTLGTEEITFDLSHTKITSNFWYRWSGAEKGDKFLFPTTITSLCLQNNEMYGVGGVMYPALIADPTNAATLVNLKYIEGSNCYWKCFWNMVQYFPAVETVNYYMAKLTTACSFEDYIDNLKDKPIKNLYLYGANSDYWYNQSKVGANQLRYVSQIKAIESLKMCHLSGLNDVSFLKDLSNLKTVNLSHTAVSSLSFICYENDEGETVFNMPNLLTLYVDKTSITKDSYDENGSRIDNLEVLKKAFTKGLRYADISSTGITADEVLDSGITSLSWSSFTY